MKKILITLAMLLSMLVPVTIAASPASAATCTAYKSVAWKTIYSQGGDVGDKAGNYTFTATMYYRACPSLNVSYVDSYNLQIYQNYGTCGITRNWIVNPDIIGSYNPGSQTAGCSTSDTVDLLVWDPAAQPVYSGHTGAARCIGGTVTLDNSLATDTNYSLPVVCL